MTAARAELLAIELFVLSHWQWWRSCPSHRLLSWLAGIVGVRLSRAYKDYGAGF